MQVGDRVFLKESVNVTEVIIIKLTPAFATVKYVDHDGGLRVNPKRLFTTKEEAEKGIRR